MKITKCDRCGKIDEMMGLHSFGITSFHIGAVKLYQLGADNPSIEYLDLCRKCQSELDKFVNKFMEETE